MGGMQRHSRLLAEHLAKREGIRLTVLHPHAETVFDPAFGIEELRIAPIDEGRTYLRELWRYSGRVAEVLDGLAPDVILSQGFCVWRGIERFSDRLIVHPHGLEMFQGITLKERAMGSPFRKILRWIVRRSAVVVSLGGGLTNILQGLVDGSACRVVVLPNAVELPAIAPAYPSEDEPVRLLFVGRFAFNKGIDILLDVARRFSGEGKTDAYAFTLAGDGPERARMEAEGLPPNVVLAGKVDDARLEELYAGCHALVLPTRFEGMPTVVLEAMARARPAFVSDVGATAELVDGGNGLLLPKGDAGALHGALLNFHSLSTTERTVLGEEGRSRVEERFTWPAVTDGFRDLFRAVAQSATQRE